MNENRKVESSSNYLLNVGRSLVKEFVQKFNFFSKLYSKLFNFHSLGAKIKKCFPSIDFFIHELFMKFKYYTFKLHNNFT